MAQEKKLYPLRLIDLQDTYGWGTDTFKLADLGYRDSIVSDGWLAANSLSDIMETYMDRVTGDHVFQVYGRQFPVQLRLIRCEGKMPLQGLGRRTPVPRMDAEDRRIRTVRRPAGRLHRTEDQYGPSQSG